MPNKSQTRTVKLRLGDWSGDGHNITEDVLVKISGEDVSNKALAEAKDKAEKLVGFTMESVFSRYEDYRLPHEKLVKLILSGVPAVVPYDFTVHTDGGNWAIWDEDLQKLKEEPLLVDHADFLATLEEAVVNEEGFSVLHFVMAFLGYGIEDFSFKLVNHETILGDFGAPIKGFGYGLYYS